MPFDRIFLDELSARNDIVEIVSQYVQLKKSGANYFGLCPFHNEKTGSFSVSPDKQIFHCFGCGAGGGVITFIMKAEGLTFPDAVRYLAERAGMQIPEQGEAERKAARHRERLYRTIGAKQHTTIVKSPAIDYDFQKDLIAPPDDCCHQKIEKQFFYCLHS